MSNYEGNKSKKRKNDRRREVKKGPAIKKEEIPFVLPEGWIWCRGGEVTYIFAGYSFKSYEFTKALNGIKCIKITNAGVKQIIETEDRLPFEFQNKYKSFLVKTDDLVIALTRPYISSGLKISRCTSNFNNSLLNQRVAAIRNNCDINWDYIYVYDFRSGIKYV